ncbi:hypothetical protein, conserved [Babesia bigemina]|uniref:Uncharacterized protein n=1 Tax=Babesia bigemina TaxID=5866 RepID=A0A061DCL0_BABBI|nr:hypothetical protein, conserved [Babesia bigemina]CDR96769.1 hypothetical protein, conserved [Babesia bigemina]|eukprot:XP_012768955.1 hypothetical protein, conserved [Babesia bigemina]
MALNSEEGRPAVGEQEDSGLHGDSRAGVVAGAPAVDGSGLSSESMGEQIAASSREQPAKSATRWEDAVLATQTAVTEHLESFKVKAETPIPASTMPCILDENTKVVGETQEGQQGPAGQGPGAVLFDSYYQLPPKELIALAASATRSCSLFSFRKDERRSARRAKADDPRSKNSVGHEDGRHGNLIPYEPLLEPMNIPGHDQPLEPENGHGKPHHSHGHEQRSGGANHPKHPGRQREHTHPKGGAHMPGDRKPKHTDGQPLPSKQNTKAKGPAGGAGRWSAPKPTDGIFSLGSLRPESPSATPNTANDSHAMSFKNLSQMVHDLHIKKTVSLRHSDDVMNMTPQDVSNFTFIDEESHIPLKSSQFSKFFSVVGQQHKAGRFPVAQATIGAEQARLAAQGEGSDIPGMNVAGDAKNRERASQLLQQMLARKTSP